MILLYYHYNFAISNRRKTLDYANKIKQLKVMRDKIKEYEAVAKAAEKFVKSVAEGNSSYTGCSGDSEVKTLAAKQYNQSWDLHAER